MRFIAHEKQNRDSSRDSRLSTANITTNLHKRSIPGNMARKDSIMSPLPQKFLKVQEPISETKEAPPLDKISEELSGSNLQ
jgi:hypothetical protein